MVLIQPTLGLMARTWTLCSPMSSFASKSPRAVARHLHGKGSSTRLKFHLMQDQNTRTCLATSKSLSPVLCASTFRRTMAPFLQEKLACYQRCGSTSFAPVDACLGPIRVPHNHKAVPHKDHLVQLLRLADEHRCRHQLCSCCSRL
jgi:hypothetical protein